MVNNLTVKEMPMTPLRYREIIKYSLLITAFAIGSALDGRYDWTVWWLMNVVGVLKYA